jgi:hypothetical protein
MAGLVLGVDQLSQSRQIPTQCDISEVLHGHGHGQGQGQRHGHSHGHNHGHGHGVFILAM